MTAPSYMVPEGIPRPSHIRATAALPLLPGKGPEGLSGAMYGRPYDPVDTYVQTCAGWWMCLDNVHARDLVRVNLLPGVRVGSWIVPHILKDEVATVGYYGPEGYVIPEVYRETIDRLRAQLDEVPGLTCTQEQASLAAEILAINYHISIVELGYWQTLTPVAVWMILQGALGIAPAAGA